MPTNDASQEIQEKSGVPLRVKIRREIARASDDVAKEAAELADVLLDSNKRNKKKFTTTQMRQLESIAYTTLKVSDITDLVKNQIGRERWPVPEGQQVLEALQGLCQNADRIARSIDPNGEHEDLARRMHLLLCREYVHHLVAHFLYADARNTKRN